MLLARQKVVDDQTGGESDSHVGRKRARQGRRDGDELPVEAEVAGKLDHLDTDKEHHCPDNGRRERLGDCRDALPAGSRRLNSKLPIFIRVCCLRLRDPFLTDVAQADEEQHGAKPDKGR